MSWAKYGDTADIEYNLKAIERLAKRLKFKLSVGAKIGKYPQSVVLDHKYQDGIIHVSDNPKYGISFEGQYALTLSKLKELMKQKLAEESGKIIDKDEKDFLKAFKEELA